MLPLPNWLGVGFHLDVKLRKLRRLRSTCNIGQLANLLPCQGVAMVANSNRWLHRQSSKSVIRQQGKLAHIDC